MNRTFLRSLGVGLYLSAVGDLHAAPPPNPESQVSLAAAKREIAQGDSAAAIIELKNALKADPNNSEARYELAVLYLATSNPSAALQELENAQARGYDLNKIAPLLGQTYLVLGRFQDVIKKVSVAGLEGNVRGEVLAAQARAHIALEDYKAAKVLVNEALEVSPNLTSTLIASAMLLQAEGKIDEAELQANKAAPSDNQVELLILKGQLRQKKNDLAAAAKYFDQAVSAFPQHMVARIQRATVSIARNQLPAADADIAWVLARDPKQPYALFLRAFLLSRDKKFREARQIMQGLAQLTERYPPALLLLAETTFQDGAPELALDFAQRYVRSMPDDPGGRKLLALIYQRQGDGAQAVAQLEPLAEKYPEDNRLKLQLAGALLQSGRSEDAIKAFQQGLAADPANAQAQLALAMGQLSSGKVDQAEAGIGKIVEADPGSIQANTLLVLTKLHMRKPDEALAVAEAMVKANDKDPNAHNLHGTIYLAINNFDSARTSFQKALKINPQYAPAALNLAHIEERAGNEPAAKAWYEKVLSLNPNNLTAYDGIVRLALRSGNVDAAAGYYKQAIARDPTLYAPRLRLINMLLERDRPAQALIEARDLANAMPQLPQALDALASAQHANREWANALGSYQRLAAQNPNNPEAQRRLGRAYLSAADADQNARAKYVLEARDAFDRALVLTPDDFAVLADRLELEGRMSSPTAALTLAQKFADAQPASASRLVLLGDIQAVQKKKAEADASYRRAWETSKTSLTTIRLYGSLVQNARIDEGGKLLKDWVDNHADDYDARFLLANHYLTANKPSEAIAETESLIVLFPENASLLNNLAWLYSEKDPQKAVRLAEKAYSLAPQSPDVIDTLGWLHVTAAPASKAEGLLQKAYEMAPARGDIGFHYAVALEKNNKRALARSVLERVLAGNSIFAERTEAQALLGKINSAQ